ncbi:response regulator [Paenibacillus sp. GCM10023248]|uniref:response regulator n=1 Tax=unclassified Paenibacillus TaxID=185978 RepID=UPI0023786F58|nr:response regulator [Paenibacillus sp. MAHUQ-63]MDD9268164.1 response regulator [Paenibacillus sp. MAHUQ-63]
MYTLLIVDDERWVRQGLRTTIDWQAEGIEVLGDAEDGEDALQMMRDRMPDIIITDIKMPRMDGLALIEAVKSHQGAAKIIIMSGYSDFSYAQQAMRLGAVDYVLKPIEETQMLEVVRKCIAQLQQEREEQAALKQMSERIRESMPLARQQYLEALLTNVSASSRFSQSLWDRLRIPLDPNRMQVIHIQVYDWGLHEHQPSEHYLLRHAIGNLAQEIGKSEGAMAVCLFDDEEETDLVILHTPAGGKEGSGSAAWEALIDDCRKYLGVRINIGISSMTDIASLHASFQEAVHAAAHAFYEGYGKVYDAARSSQEQSLHKFVEPSGWSNRIVHAVKLGDEASLGELLDELLTHLDNSRAKCTPRVLRSGFIALLQELERKLEVQIQIPYCALHELKGELLAVLLPYRYEEGAAGNRKRFIELAMIYIEQHYTEAITLNRVAEHLYLNPSYFSKIFHERTGETFSKYIIRLRMNKAKELLKDSTLRIYQVADQVGYQDFRHFVKLFKEHEGMTPAQYRDRGI